MPRRLKNTTGAALYHPASGVSLDAGYNTVNPLDIGNLMDTQLMTWMTAAQVVFNDGTNDVTDPATGWLMLEGTVLPFSNTYMTAKNSSAAFEELRTTQPVLLTYDRSGLALGGSYFLNGIGFVLPRAMRISEISVSSGTTIAVGTATIELHRRTAFGSYSAIAGASVALGAGQYRNTASGLAIAVASGSEVCAYLAGALSLTNINVTVTLVSQ